MEHPLFYYQNYLLWFLATPVQFFIARDMYISAYKALKNRTANMDSLVILGTNAELGQRRYEFAVVKNKKL